MTFYRRDDDVQNGLGQAMPNIAVTYLTQPGGALASVYADPAGATPIANPQYTNGLGQAVAYLAAGQYTVTYSGSQIQTLTYTDQSIGGAFPGGSGPLVITPNPNGVVRVFTLSQAPPNPSADLVFVAGSYVPYGGTTYTVSGTTLTWLGAVPPQTGDSFDYFIL
jgi:hypothetical protein